MQNNEKPLAAPSDLKISLWNVSYLSFLNNALVVLHSVVGPTLQYSWSDNTMIKFRTIILLFDE